MADTVRRSFALIIPTLDAAWNLDRLLPALKRQTAVPDRIIILDSQSTDGTAELFREAGAEVVEIPRGSFDHGGTRQVGAEMAGDVDVLLYMTQDAIPAHPEAFARLLAAFDDPRVGVAYGRQLPLPDASAIATQARLFNYPDRSSVTTLADVKRLGIRAVFCSDAFAAYRRSAVATVGGFPSPVIWGEDALLSARLMLHGWSKAYVADARVFHSHDYRLGEYFRLYFDAGVSHAHHPWLTQLVGGAGGEGKRFALRQLTNLASSHPLQVPKAAAILAVRYLGYAFGRHSAGLPDWMRRHMTRNRTYWTVRERTVPADRTPNPSPTG